MITITTKKELDAGQERIRIKSIVSDNNDNNFDNVFIQGDYLIHKDGFLVLAKGNLLTLKMLDRIKRQIKTTMVFK